MERLWSPWRSHYIESFQGTKKNGACVFCDALAANDDRGKFLVHRGMQCFILMNLYPYNNGHLLVIPNRHIARLDELNGNEERDLMEMLGFGVDLLEKGIAPQGFNIGANLGRPAGAGIDEHLHFHIVPRWNGDTNFMPVLNDVKMISEEMEKTYARLINAKDALLADTGKTSSRHQ